MPSVKWDFSQFLLEPSKATPQVVLYVEKRLYVNSLSIASFRFIIES